MGELTPSQHRSPSISGTADELDLDAVFQVVGSIAAIASTVVLVQREKAIDQILFVDLEAADGNVLIHQVDVVQLQTG